MTKKLLGRLRGAGSDGHGGAERENLFPQFFGKLGVVAQIIFGFFAALAELQIVVAEAVRLPFAERPEV